MDNGRIIKRADPSTIHDKFLVGYQGWFTCGGDGEPVGPGHHGWLHWFNYPIPDGGRPNMDIWPDVSEYTPSELFPAPGVKYANGEQAFLFSSRHPKTVQRHFHWMAMHGVDGAFLQRFAGQTDMEQGNEGIRKIRDEVGDRVREAAEKEGRVFAIMYDVSGVAPDRIQRVIERDWVYLMRSKAILDSPAYLRERGRPVIALWGFGMSDSHHSPETVRAIARFIRSNTPGGAYIMAGVAAHWRTSVADADSNPEFIRVWTEEFDAISPWTIGRYHDEEGADHFEQEKIKGDVELIRQHNERLESNGTASRKIDYIPVVWPGGSGYNLSEGKWGWNDGARKGGNFLWRQLYNVRRHNVRTVYGAMWDEYDEGTAFMPVVSHKRQLPVLEKYRFMALDEDGFDLPPDWYMRICGYAAESLRGERVILGTFPSKELQDYWANRPHYEDEAGPSSSAGGSGSGAKNKEDGGQTWDEWQKMMASKDNGDELPPPPYSLEADESEPEPQVLAVPQVGRAVQVVSSPPPVPLERRPTQTQGPPPTPLSTRPAPPPVNSGSRPQNITGTPSHPSSPQLQSQFALVDDFSRLSMSSSIPPSPHLDQGQYSLHSTSPSPRPISPALSRTSSHSAASAPYSSAMPAHNTNPFRQSAIPASVPVSSSTPGPYSQAPWPPPEWNSSQGQPGILNQLLGGGDSSHHAHTPPQQRSNYAPTYLSNNRPAASPPHSSNSPPPLAPRPSMSHHTRSSSPPTPNTLNHDHVGGFAFPEAHTSGGPSGPDSRYYSPSGQSAYSSPPGQSAYSSSPYHESTLQATSYNPPGSGPSSSYGPPPGPPHHSNSYGAPSEPPDPYGAPAGPPPGHPSYGGPPSNAYGAPTGPSDPYGPPTGPPPSLPQRPDPYGSSSIPSGYYSPIPPDPQQQQQYAPPPGPGYPPYAPPPPPGPVGGYGLPPPQHPGVPYGRPPPSPQPYPGQGYGGGPLGSVFNRVGNLANARQNLFSQFRPR